VPAGSKTRLEIRLNCKDFTSAIMYLDPGQTSLDGDCMRLSLGAPVLRWRPQEADDPEFQALAHTVLKQCNTTEYVNLGLRCIRTKRQLWKWKTNEVPGPGHMAAMGGPDELVQDLEAAVPYLTKIATHLLCRDEGEGIPLEILGFYLLSNWIHEQNVPDTKVLVQMAGHKLGVYHDNFRLELKIETTKATESDDQGVSGHES